MVSHLPGTTDATRVRANATISALQLLPDSTLQGLAASSVGLRACFYLARVPRLVTAASTAPAMIIGAAIILRPGDRVSRSEAAPLGARVADSVTGFMGSWLFIVIQLAIVLAWLSGNIVLHSRPFDPFPFILLNLAFSTQAA